MRFHYQVIGSIPRRLCMVGIMAMMMTLPHRKGFIPVQAVMVLWCVYAYPLFLLLAASAPILSSSSS